jgi:hypothetical protein
VLPVFWRNFLLMFEDVNFLVWSVGIDAYGVGVMMAGPAVGSVGVMIISGSASDSALVASGPLPGVGVVGSEAASF